jgi:hypothetical protein
MPLRQWRDDAHLQQQHRLATYLSSADLSHHAAFYRSNSITARATGWNS